MNYFFTIIASLAVSTTALANSGKDSVFRNMNRCGNFVHFDQTNLYSGFGSYSHPLSGWRTAKSGFVNVHPLDGSNVKTWSTDDSAVDVVTYNNRAFVLTYSNLEEWDLTTHSRVAKYPTHGSRREFARKEHPMGLDIAGDQIVIAHGSLGVSIFDLNSRSIIFDQALIQSQSPLKSMATDVAIVNDTAFILMDNLSLVGKFQKPAFRGLVLLDIKNQKVISELDKLDPGADAIVANKDKLIISFMGQPIWSYKTADFRNKKKKMPRPHRRSWKFGSKGHPTKKPFLENENYYTCFSMAPNVKGGRYTRGPMKMNTVTYFGI